MKRFEIDQMIHEQKSRTSVLILFTLGVCLATSGCPKPPIESLSDARAAVERAKAEGADIYAAEQLLKAEGFLQQAEKEMETGRNRDARDHSINARKRAERAEEIAAPKREEARAEARGLIEEAQALFDKAEAKDVAFLAPDEATEARQAFQESERAFSEKDYVRSAGRAADAMVHLEDAIRLSSEKAVHRVEEETTVAEAPVLPDVYTVRRGESLWRISGYTEVYNDPLMWRLIYMANRDQIKDWGFIYPGQVLTIQRDATPEQVREARRLAGAKPPFTPPDEANRPY